MNALRASTVFALALCSASASALTVQFYIIHQYCGFPNGRVEAIVSGGVPPYTYSWSNGSTDQVVWNIEAGTYSVTVTDFVGTQATEVATVNSFVEFPNRDYDVPLAYCDPYSFTIYDPLQFIAENVDLPLYAPLDIQWVETENIGGNILVLQEGDPGGSYVVTYLDMNGCMGTMTLHVGYPVDFPQLSVLSIEGACATTASGRIEVASTAEGHDQFVDLELKNRLTLAGDDGRAHDGALRPEAHERGIGRDPVSRGRRDSRSPRRGWSCPGR